MGNVELQELVKAYADGKLIFSDYREQRAELVDSITGNITLKNEQPEAKSEEKTSEERVAAENEIDDSEENISLVNNRSPVVFLLIVTIVLVSFVYILTII